MPKILQNLARDVDHDNPRVDPIVQKAVRSELEAAGIGVHDHEFLIKTCGEVPTSVMGELAHWSFRRAWYYWMASGPGIPPQIAEEFHKQWGQEVRVLGHCGCPSPLESCHGFAVGSYHIDTQEGLSAFADLLRSIYVPKETHRA